ncbi:migration and invasion-inhibitory protein isoform X1 [Myotis daubentonii]|uniref:migration and invasion-inhibitory protein isoform X1 n=1 Tax=Myotis daubentonii TaxID=98922 RepID=UPI0028738EF7|nr:migration and invasion-inhibitory protein isoform X1 [Myotis daubentonii]XP_059547217.1 migration and invasion-inhibitory protein isoform X1 [Myotis daubentonii]XP_059547218.1 migration and invasion-inhibitory protein isoform X1 [Myotis daubentonii]XP_059547219.1 migration and invasion-inhibitory protein isoform X1 [Myotis daubentonii]
MPGMVETKDLAQLRQLNLELLRQLWVGQDAMRQLVAKAASESSLDSSSSCDSEMPLSPKTPSMAQRTSSPRDANQGDSCGMSSLGASSGVTSLPPVREPRSPLRPCGAPLLATSDSSDSERSAELEAQVPRSLQDQPRKLPKLRVTFNKESPVPERSWRLRPYLGYDWIAGSLDNSSPIGSKPEAFFSKLQEFRETHKEECIHSEPEPQFPGRRESDSAQEDHECVYCYHVNRRLFLVPSDPGTPCRLCRTPRDQRGPTTLADPAQVRVSIPQSILDPPHRYRIHRRKSFDTSDMLSLPRHCLLGWDILPPKPEKSSGPQSLDLWSCVTSEAQHQPLSAGPFHLAQSVRVPSPTLIWSELQAPQPHPRTLVDDLRTGHLEDSVPAIASSLFPLAGVPMRREPCPASARGGLRPHPPRWGRWVGPGLSPSWAQKG